MMVLVPRCHRQLAPGTRMGARELALDNWLVPANNSPHNNTIRHSQVLKFFITLVGLSPLHRSFGRFATSLKLTSLALLAKHRQSNINRRSRPGASLQHDVLKTDSNLHKRLKLVTHQQTWRGVRLLRDTCDFSANSPKWIFSI